MDGYKVILTGFGTFLKIYKLYSPAPGNNSLKINLIQTVKTFQKSHQIWNSGKVIIAVYTHVMVDFMSKVDFFMWNFKEKTVSSKYILHIFQ